MGKIELLSADPALSFSETWYEIADDDHFWIRWRSSVLLKEIEKLGLDLSQPLSGLDVGCGHGAMLRHVTANTAWRLDGCDLNKTALSMNLKHPGRLLFYNIHDRRAELREHYDFLMLLDVIEHIEETRPFLESALFHLKPGGYVFVNVPAGQALYSKYDVLMGHCRRYNRALLGSHLRQGGLEVCSMRYWGMLMVPIALARRFYVARIKDREEVAKAGFQPPGRLAVGLMHALWTLERTMLPHQPIGTSLLAVARKPASC